MHQSAAYSKKGLGGFTLLEVTIAMGLLASATIVFLSIWVIVIVGIKSKRIVIANHIASRKIEQIRQTDFALLPSSGPFSDPALGDLPDGAALLEISDYMEVGDMKRVRVTVSWTEPNGTKIYGLDTVVAKGATYPPPQ